jgi:2'-5' RNA ligase
MHAVVSLFEQETQDKIEQIWKLLNQYFGIESMYATPIPHYSYHVSSNYEKEKVKKVLEHAASSVAPFSVKTAGIGIFPGELPVLFMPVVRTPQLTKLHQLLWDGLGCACDMSVGSSPLYSPENWIPHVTLAHGDIHVGNLCRIIRMLQTKVSSWEISVDNISLIWDSGSSQEVLWKLPLTGKE